MSGIWVFAENYEHTLELLNAGRNLADKIGSNLVAFAITEQFAQEYIEHGADEVLLLPSLDKEQPLEAYVPVMVEAARKTDPDVFLIGATKRGKEMAIHIATRLNTGLCTECNSFTFDQEKKLLVMERLIYGGKAVQKLVCTTRPQMATVPARTFEKAQLKEGSEGKITSLPPAPPYNIKVIKRTPKVQETVDITEAKIIVSVGRGVEKKEDIALAQELANVLGGVVGCSRPVAEDLHWLPEDVYMGISGKKVKPDLYIGLGVSGQIQHITGIRDSKVILAINCDENAPIFDAADYGIVGDLYDVVPKLIKEFSDILKK